MRRQRIAHVFAWVLLAGGCADRGIEGEPEGFRIINGDPAPSTTPEYAAVVGMHFRSGSQASLDPYCSGTLIAEDVVLTAAHCCDENGNPNTPNYDPSEPEEVAFFFGEGPAFINGVLNGEFVAVSEVLIYPDFDRKKNIDDLCLVRLEEPYTAVDPVPPLPAALGLSSADVGIALDHVGFGYADLAKTQYGVKLHSVLPLGAMGCPLPGCPSGMPTDSVFSYEQPTSGPCDGDSGGPQLVDRGGTIYVAGVTSFGDAACQLVGGSTHVAAFESFIDDFVGGGTGGTTGGSDGGGSTSGTTGGAGGCGDGTCGVGESCDGRNGTVACMADCPGKVNGPPNGRYCWVEGVCEGPGC